MLLSSFFAFLIFIQPVFNQSVRNCPDPRPPLNGNVLNSNVKPGAEISYECRPNHKLIGVKRNICQQNGRWKEMVPFCLPVCEPPKPLPDRQHLLVYGERIGDTKLLTSVDFSCNYGFTLVGKEETTCKNGVWSDDEPQCELTKSLKCDEPETPELGSKNGDPPYQSGSSITFSCKDRLAFLIGSQSITCSAGKWSARTPSCLVVSDKNVDCETTADEILDQESATPIRIKCPATCDLSQASVYGTVIYKSSSSVCRAAQHNGLTKTNSGIGESVLIVNNGEFSRFVSSSLNGVNSLRHAEQSSSFQFKHVVEQIGEGENNGCPSVWKKYEKSCILVLKKKKAWSEAFAVCGNLNSKLIDAKNADVSKYKKLMSEEGVSSTWLRTNCWSIEAGQFGIIKNSLCKNTKEFICQLQQTVAPCKDPGEISGGNRKIDKLVKGSFNAGSTITYSCIDRYYLTGKPTITCLASGRWTNEKPKCEKVQACQKLPEVSYGSLDYSISLTNSRSQPDRANSRSARNRPSNRSGRMNHRDFSADNSRVGRSLGGEENHEGSLPDGYYKIGTKATFSCESKYYRRRGSKIRTCKEPGEWSGRPVSCVPVCGMSSAPRAPFILNGNVSEVGQWPWQVGVATWRPVREAYVFDCGGCLLNDNWVLTAAHCVTYQNTARLIPLSQFRIYLGKYYRNTAVEEDQVQIRDVLEIRLHEDYNFVFLDADIALIKMRQPVRLSSRVRPICLPTERTTSVNLIEGTVGVVTGWGNTENGTVADTLQQARVPVVSTSTCLEDYKSEGYDITVTDYMFCAGYKEGRMDACRGDSGGPFVFQDRFSGRWTLEGIVSWGSPKKGCGHPRQYGGYVRVERFLNWIDKTV